MNWEAIMMAAGPEGESNWTSMALMWGLILVVFYFFMIRPQQRKSKEEKKFRETLDKNSKIVTIGGLHGIITDLQDTTVTIKLEGGGKVKIEKSAISPSSTASLGTEPGKK